MSRFTILLAGDLDATPRLRLQVAGSRIIAADGGIVHAQTLGVEPELWVGDFDSTPDHVLEHNRHLAREVHPRDKDRTDGELAIEVAIARGAKHLILAGGIGGQTDHAMAHLLMGIGLARRAIGTLVTSGREEAYALLPGTTLIDLPAGSRISILALSELGGLTLEGVKWPLEDATVPLGSSWTLSNVSTGRVRVALKTGQAVAVAYPAGN